MTGPIEEYDLGKRGHGLVTLFSYDPTSKRIFKTVVKKNLILFSGADIFARLLAGQNAYAVNAVYLEYANTAGSIAIPAFDRTGGVDYYNGLSGSPTVDFLRVPLLIDPGISSTGADYTGNRVTFLANSQGSVGFHGKPFEQSSNSRVYGAALVSAPSLTDQSQDIVFSRVYMGGVAGWDVDVEKIDGLEIGITWAVDLQ